MIMSFITWGVLSFTNPSKEQMETKVKEDAQYKEFQTDANILVNSTDKEIILKTILKFQSKGILDDCIDGWSCDYDQKVLKIGEARLVTLKAMEKTNETK